MTDTPLLSSSRQPEDADAALLPKSLVVRAQMEDNPTMTELSKILPPDLENWLESRLTRGDYVDAEDFIRDLVRREKQAEADDAAWVREMIAEGEASGYLDADPSTIIEEIIAERRARRG